MTAPGRDRRFAFERTSVSADRGAHVRLLAFTVTLSMLLAACTGGIASSTPSASVSSSPTARASATNTPAATGDIAIAADVVRASASPGDAPAAAASINAFGLDLYRQVGTSGGNFVVSPASVAIALAMARAGAGGATAAQMDAVLHAVGADAAGLNALDQALAARSGTFTDTTGLALPVTLRIANAPFTQRGLALLPAYLDALAAHFGAGVRLVDYRSDPEAARQVINAWVKAQTDGRIPELLKISDVTTSTLLTLVNAIYLKAPWATPFLAEATKPSPFIRPDGSIVEVPMMSQSSSLSYAEGPGWRAVELPYVGGSLALTLIVPDDLHAFEAGLTPQMLTQLTTALQRRAVQLTLPKFTVETSTRLAAALKALGMPLAFTDQADFSGITTEARLYISDVIHQANIGVDEKGTEASAATALVMGDMGAPGGERVTLRVDRPFLFALRDLATGAILFLGRVTDPSAN